MDEPGRAHRLGGDRRGGPMSEPAGVTIIQARLRSTRFPHKVLADLGGKPVLQWVMEAAAGFGLPVIVAVPVQDMGSMVTAVETPPGVAWYGSDRPERDVLGRFVDALKFFESPEGFGGGLRRYVLRVTADSPFMDPAVGRQLIRDYLIGLEWDYIANCYPPPDTPDGGLDVEAVRRAVLLAMDIRVTDPREREHLTRHLWSRPDQYRCLRAPVPRGYGTLGLRWMVDTPEDLGRLRGLLGAGYDGSWQTLYDREREQTQERAPQ